MMPREPSHPANDANCGNVWRVGQDDTLSVCHFDTWRVCALLLN